MSFGHVTPLLLLAADAIDTRTLEAQRNMRYAPRSARYALMLILATTPTPFHVLIRDADAA